jgi:hypothetical protein
LFSLEHRDCLLPLRRPLYAAETDAPYLHTGFVDRRVQQRRVPQSPAAHRACAAKIISPLHQIQVFLRESSSAISGFRSLRGRKQRSSFSHRA